MKNIFFNSFWMILFILACKDKDCVCGANDQECINDVCQCKPEYYQINDGDKFFCRQKQANRFKATENCNCVVDYFMTIDKQSSDSTERQILFENSSFFYHSTGFTARYGSNEIRDTFFGSLFYCQVDEGQYALAHGVKIHPSKIWTVTFDWHKRGTNDYLSSCTIPFTQ